ncbi:TetR/AcrR family transcriptional regulator [Sedimentibacter sp. MB31-C6]|uniref:TetR/AcrR family transcriptional regulator n=1 Tax=Sedimentibacter sp. MB31-C6 TaxID=3109366 RepID=UPI002DDCB950|nr:TetR/AcrR family transcriptional regulator [Sedimentibacter sp. MB36-C1]WSI04673.1 TetR/AcrR family transcriptional regulator [Sedimentibacter sp. MB36-C1]
MRVTKTAVVQAASDIADEKGLNNVSLKAVAEKLNIRTPSLYNHIDSLDDLLREMAHNGMSKMNERMTKVSIGNYGDTAIKSVAVEYLNYTIEHSGIYETIQWATWHGTEKTEEIFGNYTSLLLTLIRSCNFKQEYTNEILNLLTSILHGYTTLQLRYAFSDPDKVRKELCNAIDTLLLGIHQKYDQ